MIRTRHYSPNSETAEQRAARLALATRCDAEQTREYVAKPEGIRWKGIVDGTEVRVSPRWKPSKQARQHYGRTRSERKRQQQSAPIRHRNDLHLLAKMDSIHDGDN